MRRKRVDVHVQAGDYFGTLATLLSLMEQDVISEGWNRKYARWLRLWIDDLVYLQRHYKIERK